MIRGVIENLAEVKFQIYILYSQDDKRERVSNLLLDVEARGFFRQQWALGSVFVQLGHLPLLGQVVWNGAFSYSAVDLCKDIKHNLLQAQINKIIAR